MFNQMLMISALSFICICVATFFLFNALNKQNSNTKQGQQIKNIILILADDLGMKEGLVFQINRIMIVTLLKNLIH